MSDTLSNVLVAEGYFVIPAENGQQALDLANQLPMDLVLLDPNMPVKNGWDTFERRAAEHPLLPITFQAERLLLPDMTNTTTARPDHFNKLT